MRVNGLLVVIFIGIFTSCKTKKIEHHGQIHDATFEIEFDHAKGLKISKDDQGLNRVTISDPWQNAKNIRFDYYFTSDSTLPGLEKPNVFLVPPAKVVCMSTSHIPYIDAVGGLESIQAVSGLDYVNDKTLEERAASGLVFEAGYGQALNMEEILEAKPDIVFMYGVSTEMNSLKHKLNELGIKTMFVSEYLENTPLGKAEWIKLFGLIYNQVEKADSCFSAIEARYNAAREILGDNLQGPRVLTGIPWKDDWYVPEGNSYMANFVKDAGGDYLFSKLDGRDSRVVELEEIYSLSNNVDVWINTGSARSLAEIEKVDSRLAGFSPFTEGMVFNNNARLNKNGGNDFYESAVINPDIVLKDLIYIFHPDLLQGHKLVYYQKIYSRENGK